MFSGTWINSLSGTKLTMQTGHNKGVTKIELFPTSGHLLLSGSLDIKIKVCVHYHSLPHVDLARP